MSFLGFLVGIGLIGLFLYAAFSPTDPAEKALEEQAALARKVADAEYRRIRFEKNVARCVASAIVSIEVLPL